MECQKLITINAFYVLFSGELLSNIWYNNYRIYKKMHLNNNVKGCTKHAKK